MEQKKERGKVLGQSQKGWITSKVMSGTTTTQHNQYLFNCSNMWDHCHVFHTAIKHCVRSSPTMRQSQLHQQDPTVPISWIPQEKWQKRKVFCFRLKHYGLRLQPLDSWNTFHWSILGSESQLYYYSGTYACTAPWSLL